MHANTVARTCIKANCKWRQWCLQSHYLQSDHIGRGSHTHSTMADLPERHKDHSCYHSHRLSEAAAKRGVWGGLSWLAYVHAQPTAAKTTVDLLPWPCHRHREMNGQTDWQAWQTSQPGVRSPAWQTQVNAREWRNNASEVKWLLPARNASESEVERWVVWKGPLHSKEDGRWVLLAFVQLVHDHLFSCKLFSFSFVDRPNK